MPEFYDAFISYGRADSKGFAVTLCDRLTQLGYHIWFDFNDIPLGVDFQNQINDGIEKAHNFIFIIAPHSVNSAYCAREIELALARRKRIIPILHVEQIDRDIWQQRHPHGTDEEWQEYQSKGLHSSFPNMHPEIGKINWVYFREGQEDFEQSLSGLNQIVERHKSYVEGHTQLLTQALEWERNQKQTRYLLIQQERLEAEAWLTVRFKDEQAPCIPTDLHCEFITESKKNAHNLMTQVFLAHAPEDDVTMVKIRRSLLRQGITVWTSATDIRSGDDFHQSIERGIEQADNLVYLMSPQAQASDFCQYELQYALGLHKRIIPVLACPTEEGLLPPFLKDLQYIDLTDNERDEDYRLDESQLLKILKEDAAYFEEHKTLLTQALKWERQHRNPSILLRGYNLRHAEAWWKMARTRSAYGPTALQAAFIEESLRQPPAESLDVFISYSRSDSDFARHLNDNLQIYGKLSWFDQESIAASSADFQQEIYRGIEASDNFLFILSPQSVNSPFCADEVDYAASLNKRLITVLHRPVDPADLHPELAKVQWIDFNRSDRDFWDNFNQLVRVLETDREHVHQHTKWSQRAIEWEQKQRTEDLLLRGGELAIAEQWLHIALEEGKQPAVTPLQKDYIQSGSALRDRQLQQAQAQQQKELRQTRRLALGAIGAGLVMAALAIFAVAQKRQVEIVQESQINALSRYSLSLVDNDRTFDGLIEALRAGQQLRKQIKAVTPQTRSQVLTALQASVYTEGWREQNRLSGHENDLNRLAISPDGQAIASASRDQTVRLWDMQGHLLQTLSGHQAPVNSVTFSPDGQRLASASEDRTVKLWDLEGHLLDTFSFAATANDVVFSPAGDQLAIASGQSVRLLTLDGREMRRLNHADWVNSVRFSPDGQTLVTATNRAARLWRVSGQPLGTLPHDTWVNMASFSPDGGAIATATHQQVRVWSLDGTVQHTFPHKGWVNSVRFSPDGRAIAAGESSGVVTLWDLDTETPLTLQHERDIVDTSFSPDGEVLVSTSRDDQLRLWRHSTNVLPTVLRVDGLNQLRFSPDGAMMATLRGATLQLWDPEGHLIRTQVFEDDLSDVRFSPDGQTLAIATGPVVQMQTLEGKRLRRLVYDDWVHSVDFSPDGEKLIVTSGTSAYLLASSGKRLVSILRQDEIYEARFSPDGELIAARTHDHDLQLWNLAGELVALLPHDDSVHTFSFSPDGQTLASGSDDNSLRLWTRNGAEVGIIRNATAFTRVSFSPDGSQLAALDADQTINLWNLDGSHPEPLISLNWTEGNVQSLLFSPDGTHLLVAGAEGRVVAWDMAALNLDTLLLQACGVLEDYLKSNQTIDEGDRHLCQGIGP